MLDLNEQPKIPRYELKVGEETKSYDGMLLGHKMMVIEGEEDPEVIQRVIQEIFGVEVDAFTAHVILEDFYKYAEKELDGPLKKVFGRGLFSTTTTGQAPASSENSAQPNT